MSQKIVLFAAVLFLSTLLLNVRATEIKGNINYISFGYNIFFGNPLSSKGMDPGFKTRSIFDLKFNGKKAIKGRVDVPLYVDVADSQSCSMMVSSQVIESASDLKRSMDVEAEVSAGVGGLFSFKGNAEYLQLESRLSAKKEVLINSAAKCIVYRASISPSQPPNLHAAFKLEISKLPTAYDQEAYFKVIDLYGTHAVIDVTMGARFGAMRFITQETIQNIKDMKLTVETAASASFASFSGTLSAKVGISETATNAFNRGQTYVQSTSIGAKPPVKGDAEAWVQQNFDRPLPLSYSLYPLSELMTPTFFKGAISNSKLAIIQANFGVAQKTYCTNYLLKNKLIAKC